jgi:CBS domain-containing protein
MQISEVMSRDVEWVDPKTTIDEVAEKMRESDSGAMLVGDEEEITGIITDHDIVTKVIADGRDPRSVRVEEAMSSPVEYCNEDDDVDDVAQKMAEEHILRIVVADEDEKVVGVVAHSDLADAVVKNGMYADPLAQKVAQLASKIAA